MMVMETINWNIFSAGLSLIGFAIAIFIGVAVLGKLLSIDIKLPSIIPIALFAIGLAIVVESTGLFSGMYMLVSMQIKSANIPELILSVALLIIAIYRPYMKSVMSGIFRIAVGILGLILLLDSVNVVPLSDFIGKTFTDLSNFLGTNVWYIITFIVAIMIVYGVVMWWYFSRKARRGV